MKRTLASLTAGAMLASIAAARAVAAMPRGTAVPQTRTEILATDLAKLSDGASKQRIRDDAQAI